MDYLSVFDISASGMGVEKIRMDVAAINIANAHTTRTSNGGPYKPLSVITEPAYATDFAKVIGKIGEELRLPLGVRVSEIREINVSPKFVYEPNHPDADERGYVAYPDINPVSEMVNLISITRSYEANVRTLNAAKSMAQRALEIGGR